MKYVLYVFLPIIFFVILAQTEIGQWLFIIGFVIVGAIIAAWIFSYNHDQNKYDREKFKDEDKPYFLQKVSAPESTCGPEPSPRWLVWLAWLLLPAVYGVIYFVNK